MSPPCPWSLVSACGDQEWRSERAGWQWSGGDAPRSAGSTRSAWQAHLLWPAIGMALGARSSVCNTLACRWAQQKGTLTKLESFSTAAGNYYFFREKNTVCWNTFLEELASHFRHQNKPEPKTVPQRLSGHWCHKWSCKERSDFINQTFSQGGWRGSLYLSDRAQALQTPTQSIGLPKRQATCSSCTGSAKSPSRRVPFATQMCCQT